MRLFEALRESYPDARCALRHSSAFELLIATILSAQCTDVRVNLVTPALFRRYPDAEALADASLDDLEQLVQPTGFFRQKARSLHGTAGMLMERHGGEVPREMADLVQLPGVARKTANVVISNCFPEHAVGIAVDTHVQRIARRLGLVREWKPVKVEQELVRLLPQASWNDVTHLLIDHGRAVCRAPRPLCATCPEGVARECPSRGRW